MLILTLQSILTHCHNQLVYTGNTLVKRSSSIVPINGMITNYRLPSNHQNAQWTKSIHVAGKAVIDTNTSFLGTNTHFKLQSECNEFVSVDLNTMNVSLINTTCSTSVN